MPAVATANQVIVTSSTVAEAKLTTAAKFVGGGLSSATAVLTTGMVAVWQSDGTNWRLIAGEVKRTQEYEGEVARTEGVEYEPSATRETFVTLSLKPTTTNVMEVLVSGRILFKVHGATGVNVGVSFIVPAGAKWKYAGLGAATAVSQYLFR